MEQVFVYGTLREGEPNNPKLQWSTRLGLAEIVDEGFDMYDLGPYPAVVETGALDSQVIGELYRVSMTVFADLDRLEGINPKTPESPRKAFYYRKRIKVKVLETGAITEAWIYLMAADDVRGCVHVVHGDWIKYIDKKYRTA